MERSRRLYEIWNWLVPFRAAAETESLSEASKKLHVASSAISRSVKLLEERVGTKFFERQPGSIVLNDSGRHFLSATRAAMRIMDDAMEEVGTRLEDGSLSISFPGELSLELVPHIEEMRKRFPNLSLQVFDLPEEEALLALRQGILDLAVVSELASDEELQFRPLPHQDRRIFASPNHASVGAKVKNIYELEFSVTTDSGGNPNDGFPNHEARTVALRCRSRAMVVDSLSTGWFVACLPRELAKAAGLVELDVESSLREQLAQSRMVLAQRYQLGTQPRPYEQLADALLGISGSKS